MQTERPSKILGRQVVQQRKLRNFFENSILEKQKHKLHVDTQSKGTNSFLRRIRKRKGRKTACSSRGSDTVRVTLALGSTTQRVCGPTAQAESPLCVELRLAGKAHESTEKTSLSSRVHKHLHHWLFSPSWLPVLKTSP